MITYFQKMPILYYQYFQINPKISRHLDIAKKNNISQNVYVKEIFLIADTHTTKSLWFLQTIIAIMNLLH